MKGNPCLKIFSSFKIAQIGSEHNPLSVFFLPHTAKGLLYKLIDSYSLHVEA